MNLRQQQKAAKKRIETMEMTQMYFSHANQDKNLLYLVRLQLRLLVGKTTKWILKTPISLSEV